MKFAACTPAQWSGPFCFQKKKKLMTDLITDVSDKLRSGINHKPCCNDDIMKASVNKQNLETHVKTHSSNRERDVPKSPTAELHVDLGARSPQLKMDVMRVVGRKNIANEYLDEMK